MARGFILRPMTAEMIKSFYAHTPLWFWPVLWLQIKMMYAHLAQLEERTGMPVEAIIGLGHCGTLRIIALSDASAGRYDADHWRPHAGLAHMGAAARLCVAEHSGDARLCGLLARHRAHPAPAQPVSRPRLARAPFPTTHASRRRP